MCNWLERHNGSIIFVLSIVAIMLACANAWKYNFVSLSWLKDQKDTFSSLKDIITLLIFLIVSTFSYYRFFKGRTLSLRADTDIQVSVHESPGDYNIHAFTLNLQNVGTSTIWTPKPNVKYHLHYSDGDVSSHEINDWYKEDMDTSKYVTSSVVEPDEKAYFFGHCEVPKKVWAVTYFAKIQADNGDCWFTAKTINNKEET
ncbi:MAG: hypothetical protein KQH53_19730 [Desulfarculaceae bacterium]|nr:hypothetical protein [Desulfarculaceae bacterium]